MRKVLFTGMLFLVLHSCRNTNNHDRLKFESTNETDLSIFPVHKLQYFAQDSNEIIIGDRSLGNILRIQINEDKITIKDTVKMSLDDWLQNLCLKNNKYFLVYNDSVVSDSVYLIRPHDSTFYYRINALFYPLVTDETLYLENNCKPCLDYPSTCETYTPELSINLKNGEVKEFPAKIKLSEIGSTFMKADVYSSRAIVDGNHYYSFANSSKIFVYNPDSSVIESKDARSKHQKDDFFSCSEEDTSDYVSFLIQNQICSPLYSTLVYNSKHKLFFRLFNQEQDLFQSDNKLNKLQNRRNFIQVINKELEVVDEVEITSEHFSHFMFTFGDKLFLTNIIINESGKPILKFHSFSIL